MENPSAGANMPQAIIAAMPFLMGVVGILRMCPLPLVRLGKLVGPPFLVVAEPF